MFIEIKGTNFNNKGAELMLHAILKRVPEQYPDVKFVVAHQEPSLENFQQRSKLGLYQKIGFKRLGISGERLSDYLPQKLMNAYGVVRQSKISAVLDASGFAYTDHWGAVPALNMAQSIRRWKANGRKIILLPQAMGPFSNREVRRAAREIFLNSDLVFPRDRISYGNVVDLVGERPYIYQAPDFTNILEGVKLAWMRRREDYFCIIPNYRMIDKVASRTSQNYVPFLVSAIELLTRAGEKAFILNHEGEEDERLAEEINNKLSTGIEIIKQSDPLVIKGLIGSSKAVIGSRFHGLVSALSQGVPALAVGWSHKYQMLFEDYGIPEFCVAMDSALDGLKNFMQTISNPVQKEALCQTLALNLAKEKKKTAQMWDLVWQAIDEIYVLKRRS
jgi:colanic acid/amylovoran biosynthesis protein